MVDLFKTAALKGLGGALGLLLLMSLPTLAYAISIPEVARELACPCECPLVLEDCNMSCGLEWKEEIGKFIAQGKTKQEIIDIFVGKYGDDARLTTLQRLHGKIYQYTRDFDDVDWVVLGVGVFFWVLFLIIALQVGVSRLRRGRIANGYSAK